MQRTCHVTYIHAIFCHLEKQIRCSSLELESHDCIHELVEDIAQGPPTRTLLRLQSLGTDYGSDELGAFTSSEETGANDEFSLPVNQSFVATLEIKICVYNLLLKTFRKGLANQNLYAKEM